MFKINDYVKRLGGGYTAGRRGRIIELKAGNTTANDRARVHWIRERDGRAMNLRTWVRENELKALTGEELATLDLAIQVEEDKKADALMDDMLSRYKHALVEDERSLNEMLESVDEERHFAETGGLHPEDVKDLESLREPDPNVETDRQISGLEEPYGYNESKFINEP